MIAIVDYDAGNIKSVEKALEYLGQEVVLTRDRETILNADKVILPGVGAFGFAMRKLEAYHLIYTLHDFVNTVKPFLGICLGLQLLFEESEESPGVKGLGFLKGRIVRFPDKPGYKIPQIGWNSISIKKGSRLFEGIADESYVYFVHSYYLEAEDENIIAATSEYAAHVHASVEKDNIYACQFHPEKSGEVGLKIVSNCAKL